MRLYHFRDRREAFSLVELAMAMAIVSFALISLLGLIVVGLQNNRNSEQDTALRLASDYVMSDLRGQPYPSGTTTATYVFDYQGSPTNVSGNPAIFQCTAHVMPFGLASQPRAAFAWIASNPANIVSVELTFTWPGQTNTSGNNAKILWSAFSAY